MFALLKEKSKITAEQKPKKTYEIKNFFKKQKLDSNINSQTDQIDQIESKSTKATAQWNSSQTPGSDAPFKPFLEKVYKENEKESK